MLLVVDEGERHTMTVWRWQRAHLVAKTTVRGHFDCSKMNQLNMVECRHVSAVNNSVIIRRRQYYLCRPYQGIQERYYYVIILLSGNSKLIICISLVLFDFVFTFCFYSPHSFCEHNIKS